MSDMLGNAGGPHNRIDDHLIGQLDHSNRRPSTPSTLLTTPFLVLLEGPKSLVALMVSSLDSAVLSSGKIRKFVVLLMLISPVLFFPMMYNLIPIS